MTKPAPLLLATATAYASWLAKAEEVITAERHAAYIARVATAEPLPMIVTRYQCPHCRRTRSKQAAASAHIARCWKNPNARGCKTCAHFDQVPTGDDCLPGHPCNCNNGWERCAADLSIKNGLVIDCPRWAPHPNT